jgi:Pyridoxamine 5'-phosphate oxidase
VGKQLPHITPVLNDFISRQQMFFVGTAATDGRVNISPKGMDSLRVLDPNTVAWLNVTGSGNESAAHILGNPRMTIMFCAFEGAPMILRLYGKARAIHPRDAEWTELYELFEPLPGARQVFVLEIDLVQTSCGMAVPLMNFEGQRDDLNAYNGKQSPDEIEAYWRKKNTQSIDGFPTQIFATEGEHHG